MFAPEAIPAYAEGEAGLAPQGCESPAHAQAAEHVERYPKQQRQPPCMDELSQLHPHGVFLRREALDFGYRDWDLCDARKSGVITRIRHGAYVPTATWQHLDPVGRHRLLAQAVCLTHENRVALCHVSGAVEHGLRLWEADLSRVHVVRLDGASGGRERDVIYHQGEWTPDDIYASGELLVVDPQRCALETASLGTVESGLVTLDSVLDLGLGTVESLWSTYTTRMRRSPRSAKLQITLRLVRPGSQSVGESRARCMFWQQHLPEPVLQFEVYDATGNLVGTTDFAWPDHRLLGEFDGKVKYGRLLKPGEDPGDAVFREKTREDRLREATQWGFIRLVWADLYNPRGSAERVRRMMRLGLIA